MNNYNVLIARLQNGGAGQNFLTGFTRPSIAARNHTDSQADANPPESVRGKSVTQTGPGTAHRAAMPAA